MDRNSYVLSFLILFGAGVAGFGAWGLLPFRIGCSRVEAAQPSDSQRLEELRRIIEQEIGVPSASDPSQCKLIAFGSKACGGPASYLVYSTAKTNESSLKALVNEFNQLAKKINEERNVLSDCMFVGPPRLEFVDGVCTIARD